eukprot:TRINITY_DN17007_c0_g1_i1.p1 TRINITY_DN17007_c0_g1~~TRINITY_DN17007_c0_g1_i1.p1  ORF type:complete len:397 (+),score=78.23 TRINITY_DN17007_c0_g1_i1:52-1242(+)
MLQLVSLCVMGLTPPPAVPASFTADVLSITTKPASGSKYTALETMLYDKENVRLARISTTNTTHAPPSWSGTGKDLYVQATIALNTTTFFQLDSRNYVAMQESTFPDAFAWVPFSTYMGNTTVNGVPVSEYYLSIPGTGHYYYYCTSAGTPVRTFVNTTAGGLPGVPVTITLVEETYTNLVRSVNSTYFTSFNTTAAYHPPVCPQVPKPSLVTLDVYIFHPRDNVTISNQNVADILGDTSFVCSDAISNHTAADHYDVVSWYKVEMLPVWGQYQFCNGYPGQCLGENKFYVGRELPFGMTQGGGQCDEEELKQVGTWYSMPEDAECKEGQVPGDGSCTWRVVQRMKTIDAVGCLFKELGMLSSCQMEVPPFQQTSQLFHGAFTASVGQGGCPAIDP